MSVYPLFWMSSVKTRVDSVLGVQQREWCCDIVAIIYLACQRTRTSYIQVNNIVNSYLCLDGIIYNLIRGKTPIFKQCSWESGTQHCIAQTLDQAITPITHWHKTQSGMLFIDVPSPHTPTLCGGQLFISLLTWICMICKA